MSVIVIDSLPRALAMLTNRLRESVSLEVFDETEQRGYWLTIKRNPIPASELDAREVAKELRKYRNPQPYDISVQEWPSWMYSGMSRGEKSSAM